MENANRGPSNWSVGVSIANPPCLLYPVTLKSEKLERRSRLLTARYIHRRPASLATPSRVVPCEHPSRLLLRNVETEESGSGTYYNNEACPESLDAHEVKGECEYIVDFTTCDTAVEADGIASPASRAVPSTFTALLAIATFVGAMMISR